VFVPVAVGVDKVRAHGKCASVCVRARAGVCVPVRASVCMCIFVCASMCVLV
jgi:hypothetical protein